MRKGYLGQMDEWLDSHKDATIEEAYLAGYWASSSNWINHERFGDKEKQQ